MSLAATAGGLIFGGDANGRFRAFDDHGKGALWEQNLGSPVSGFPVTFAVDGKHRRGDHRSVARGQLGAAPDA